MNLQIESRELCYEIEKLPASEQQTKVSILASNLCSNCGLQAEAINFLKRAAHEGARIVSSGDLHTEAIIEAQSSNRFWIDPETGLGWALIPWELSTMKDRKREADYFSRNQMLV